MTDDLAAFLDAVEARGPHYVGRRRGSDAIALVRMVRAVLALHKPVRVQTGTKTHGGPNEYGEACARCREPWPCADRTAALGAIPPTPTAEETR